MNSARYLPYPCCSSSSTGMKRSAAELMQYRRPVGAGPSSNTCPRCDPLLFAMTSVRAMPWVESVFSFTVSGATGFVKLGQPVRELNLSVEAKNQPVSISSGGKTYAMPWNGFGRRSPR